MKYEKSIRRFTAALLHLTGMLCATGAAWSQPYPAKPVRVIVPFPPAGANDIAARITLPKVSELMGQTFVIENRGGAGGTIGTTVVAQSKPDGYTLLVQSIASHVANAHLYRKLPYDALRDFVGVAPMARLTNVLTVHPALPAYSVKEFIALAKKRPNEILHGHSGVGSFTHLNGVMFDSRAGIRMLHVPFKGGGPAVIALLSGETQVQVAAISELISHIQSKRLRALGVTTPQRLPALPDVPPIADTIPGYESSTLISIYAPTGTPRAIVDRLNAEIGKAVNDPDVSARLNQQTLDPSHRSVDELNQRMRSDYDMVGKLLKQFDLKLD
jgi:tripartite-type tricarboxylate transporter receptor subunit TctC